MITKCNTRLSLYVDISTSGVWLKIKFIQFNSLFKASYIKQKHLTEFLYLIQQRYYRERREKVGNMSSFNSWLIFVTLLFKSFFYQSSFAGYNSSYPPSGEFLHQVNLFYLHQNDTWPGVLLSLEGKRT